MTNEDRIKKLNDRNLLLEADNETLRRENKDLKKKLDSARGIHAESLAMRRSTLATCPGRVLWCLADVRLINGAGNCVAMPADMTTPRSHNAKILKGYLVSEQQFITSVFPRVAP